MPDPLVNPPTQYATDANLAARQRLWEAAAQEPVFDLFGWVLEVAGLGARAHRDGAASVLDVGCGNGLYESRLHADGLGSFVAAVDLSLGMLAEASRRIGRSPSTVVFTCADAQRLPFGEATFDVVLAPHMLYHVPDIAAAAGEMRRVLRPGGTCVAVTNGVEHAAALRGLIEEAVGGGFELRSPASSRFSLENGAPLLSSAFDSVERVDAVQPPVVVSDVDLVTGYVASMADHYEAEVDRPWPEVVERARVLARQAMAAGGRGGLALQPVVGAFVCR